MLSSIVINPYRFAVAPPSSRAIFGGAYDDFNSTLDYVQIQTTGNAIAGVDR